MKEINIGLMGCGTVGTGVAKILIEQKDLICDRVGARINLNRVADIDTETDSYFACLRETSNDEQIWEEGVVYLMDDQPFHEIDNSCHVSLLPVKPIGKLGVGPGDFSLSVETRATLDEIGGFQQVKELIRDAIDVSSMRSSWSADGFEVGLETNQGFATVCKFYFRSLPFELCIGEGTERLALSDVEQIPSHAAAIRATAQSRLSAT